MGFVWRLGAGESEEEESGQFFSSPPTGEAMGMKLQGAGGGGAQASPGNPRAVPEHTSPAPQGRRKAKLRRQLRITQRIESYLRQCCRAPCWPWTRLLRGGCAWNQGSYMFLRGSFWHDGSREGRRLLLK
jgi:hypothetical protein